MILTWGNNRLLDISLKTAIQLITKIEIDCCSNVVAPTVVGGGASRVSGPSQLQC